MNKKFLAKFIKHTLLLSFTCISLLLSTKLVKAQETINGNEFKTVENVKIQYVDLTRQKLSPQITNEQPQIQAMFAAAGHIGPRTYDIPLVAVFMVKDEAHVIRETLAPYIEGGIKHFFIFDTGSTDDTVQITKDYFTSMGITEGYIAQEPFVDFATSRNRALDLAQEQFPTAAFLTMPDAEWLLHNGQELIKFCQEHMNETTPHSYSIRIKNERIDFFTPRLIRNDGVSRFVGVVHEVIMPTFSQHVPDPVYFELQTTVAGAAKSRKRWERDRDMLLKAFQTNPTDSRTAFYLAQTYECLGELKEAYNFYTLRKAISSSFAEENYITTYRLANITAELAKIDTNYSWEKALTLFLEAHSMRSHRAEPLIKIAEHYWAEGNRPLAFLFARRTIELNYPKEDVLFVEKSMYDWARWEMISKTAYDVGECRLGELATRKSIDVHPRGAQLYRNLAAYLDCKKGQEIFGCEDN